MRWDKSLRLDFRFQNANVVLTSQIPVGIIPPPSDPLEWLDGYTGYYVRLTDGDGRVFYVQTLRDPFRSEAETYGDDESSPLDYAILKEPEVEFSILVPDPGFTFTSRGSRSRSQSTRRNSYSPRWSYRAKWSTARFWAWRK